MTSLSESVVTNLDHQFVDRPPVLATLLPQNLIRGLTDKLYEKRKVSAIDIQRITKDALQVGDIGRVESIIYVLKHEFCFGAHINARKGGLIGLAGVAIALDDHISEYVADLMLPMMGCLSDPDARVRYYACEALYNVAKVGRGGILPFFNEAFDKLCKLSADSDANVRNGADLLDRLVKDIVLETTAFDVEAFIPLLKERVYVVNPCARQFIVSWIQALDNVPDIELLDYLHDFLDGLFEILGDSSTDIRLMAENQLTEFLREIRATGLDFKACAHIPIRHCSSEDRVVQYTALLWVKEFIVLAGGDILPFTSDIIGAILPCLAHSIPRTRDMAIWANQELMHYIEGLDHASVTYTRLDEELVKSVNTLKNEMFNPTLETKRASLRWILMLQDKMPDLMFKFVPTLMPALLRSLSDKNTKIVSLALEALAEFASHSEPLIQNQECNSRDIPPHIKHYLKQSSIPNPATSTNSSPASLTLNGKYGQLKDSKCSTKVDLGRDMMSLVLDPDNTESDNSANVAFKASSVQASRDVIVDNVSNVFTETENNPHTNSARHNVQPSSTLGTSVDVSEEANESLSSITKKARDNKRFEDVSNHLQDRSNVMGVTVTPVTPSAQSTSRASLFDSTDVPSMSSAMTRVYRNQKPNEIPSIDFAGFLDRILSLFNDNRKLLAQRGSLIVCQLCNMLSPLRIFHTMADILLHYEDLEFAEHMVFVLNSILLTSVECRELRTRLKTPNLKDNQIFYITLHLTWAHNPVALISLSLLSSTYHHASNLLPVFGDLEVSVGLLMEIDRLVKLLESPVFTFLRLHLLEPDVYPHLATSLYGLLMLLPQSQAYHTLRSRLDAIPPVHLLRTSIVQENEDEQASRTKKIMDGVNIRFDRLLAHFKAIQANHASIMNEPHHSKGEQVYNAPESIQESHYN